ncbi:TlpA family protein disulfide reductase [Daejeonella sp.]|uniref:TlpA family protein disulfide reductase n=1 Tax=Daejeonella sp. TaxID=2805397 RepID=UPI003983CA4F
MVKDIALKNYKSWINWSTISSVVMIGFILVLLLIPDTKAIVLEGLMKIGFFQPELPDESKQKSLIASTNVPSVQFQDKTGKIVSLEDFEGKVVFVNFWATWCPPCIAEMPSINKLRKSLNDDSKVAFLMVDMDSDRAKSSRFMLKRKYDLDIYLPVSQLPREYYTGSLPTTLVFDKYGRLLFKHEGGADFTNKKFVEFLKKNMI